MGNTSEKRKRQVLRAVIQEYLDTAEPVASSTIVRKYCHDVSPATIRNDMADLEERGFLAQPHASAGRIPTEAGYRIYVNELVEKDRRTARHETGLLSAVKQLQQEQANYSAREIAKSIAASTNEAVVVSIPPGDVHIAGLSNLIKKPEFQEAEVLHALAEMFDEMDTLLAQVFPTMTREVNIMIGSESPFGPELTAMFTRHEFPGIGSGLVGIVGPTRMDYDQNLTMMRHMNQSVKLLLD